MFSNARTQHSLNKNECLIMDNKIYHSGGHNQSNIIRKFLLIQLVEKPKGNENL